MRANFLSSLIWQKLRSRNLVQITALAFGLVATSPHFAMAQDASQTGSTNYVSQVDQDLTIRKIAVFPVRDNLEGIYARPIESQLQNLIRDSHQFDYAEATIGATYPTIGELEDNPKAVIALGQNVEADAFLVTQASKGPSGLSIKLDLFLKKDGQLLAQEILKDHPRYEINELKGQVTDLFRKIVKKIPYSGLILSRQGNRVTINLGKKDGITANQILSVVQIIKTNRHPRFHFLVSTEKEILGKVKVLKVDDTLSFGNVITEVDKGAIKKFNKIGGLDQVNYSDADNLNPGAASLQDRSDNQISFGKNPEEWRPARQPSFGMVGIKLGIGNYSTSTSLSDGTTLAAKDPIYPSISLMGELWLNPIWAVRFEMQQAIITTKDPSSGTSIDNQLGKYSLSVGYNFLLQDSFFGPKIQIRGGFMNYHLGASPDNTSFAETTYSGFQLGFFGSLPVSDDGKWSIGAGLNLVLFPRMQEKPFSSGASNKNTITDFSVFAEKKLHENLRLTTSLDFSMYNSNFSGSGNRSGSVSSADKLSQTHTLLDVGIAYLF